MVSSAPALRTIPGLPVTLCHREDIIVFVMPTLRRTNSAATYGVVGGWLLLHGSIFTLPPLSGLRRNVGNQFSSRWSTMS